MGRDLRDFIVVGVHGVKSEDVAGDRAEITGGPTGARSGPSLHASGIYIISTITRLLC